MTDNVIYYDRCFVGHSVQMISKIPHHRELDPPTFLHTVEESEP